MNDIRFNRNSINIGGVRIDTRGDRRSPQNSGQSEPRFTAEDERIIRTRGPITMLNAEGERQNGNAQDTLSVAETNQVLRLARDMNLYDKITVRPGSEPGTFVFSYDENGLMRNPMTTGNLRVDPEALNVLRQSRAIEWEVPQAAYDAAVGRGAPTAVAPSPTNVLAEASRIAGREVVDEREANSIVLTAARTPAAAPVPPAVPGAAPRLEVDPAALTGDTTLTVGGQVVSGQPAAAPAGPAIAAASGANATMYNGVTSPNGLHQGQVASVQQLMLDAGLDVGSRSGQPDEKWGRQSQAAFVQLCGMAQPPINPAEVDFNNLQDPETIRFRETAVTRSQALAQRRENLLSPETMRALEAGSLAERGEVAPAQPAVPTVPQLSALDQMLTGDAQATTVAAVPPVAATPAIVATAAHEATHAGLDNARAQALAVGLGTQGVTAAETQPTIMAELAPGVVPNLAAGQDQSAGVRV